MKQKLIDAIFPTLGAAALIAAFAWMLWYGTSAEVWYAGMHDAECNHSENCGCYERLCAADRGEK